MREEGIRLIDVGNSVIKDQADNASFELYCKKEMEGLKQFKQYFLKINPMPTFWTIQSLEKWKEFESTGHLIANENFIWPEFITAYKWIIKKMNERCKPCTIPGVKYPIWAWYQYLPGKMRPDLRSKALLEKGKKGVLIEFTEEFENVLLIEFYGWHMVFNSSSLEHKLEVTIIDDHEKYAWSDIIIDPSNTERVAHAIIQATVWKVDMEQVKSVKHFIAR